MVMPTHREEIRPQLRPVKAQTHLARQRRELHLIMLVHQAEDRITSPADQKEAADTLAAPATLRDAAKRASNINSQHNANKVLLSFLHRRKMSSVLFLSEV